MIINIVPTGGIQFMLLSFQIINYRSILDATIPMTYAERKAPNGYKQMDIIPFLEENNIRTVPCLAFYGANASGKSNIVKAFSQLIHIVRNKYNPKAYSPNKLHDSLDPTVFKIKFQTSGNTIIYTLHINNKEIVYEKLEHNSDCIFHINGKKTQFNKLATDVYPIEKLKTIFSVECLNQEKEFRTPFITVVGENYAGLNFPITEAYVYIATKLEVFEGNTFPFHLGLSKLAETSDDIGMQTAFQEVVSILRKLDIDITRMEYKRNELNETHKTQSMKNYEYVHDLNSKTTTATEINTFHKDIHGNEVQFDFRDESLGTRRVACILGIVLSVLKKGNVLVIDELGNSLHPFLFAEIVRMFKDKRYNKTNAQLIFTTHNTDIMDQDIMRVSEIGIVNKTLKRGTTFKRISDFEGTRNVTKFRKQYLEGNFSGIPFPYI
ncbi:MAG: AAA family ATPase [Spirochaetota bacterium]